MLSSLFPLETSTKMTGFGDSQSQSLLSGSMTPLPTSWVIQCTGGSFDGDSSTPSGSAGGLLDTKDLIDKIARLQAVAGAVMQPPPGLAIQDRPQFSTDFHAEAPVLASFSPANLLTSLPPPAAHPVPRPAKAKVSGEQVSSQGTIGHPFTCAGPCRYVKRKGGCREGADCPNCHECFWTKARSETGKSSNPANGLGEVPYSAGTRGHPDRCSDACKYVRRKGGCRDGADCPKCHFCHWRRDGLKKSSGCSEVPVGLHPPGLVPRASTMGSEDPDAASIPELDEPSLPLPQKLLGDELSSRLNNSSGRGFEAQLQDDASFVALCRDWARPGAAMENLTIISL